MAVNLQEFIDVLEVIHKAVKKVIYINEQDNKIFSQLFSVTISLLINRDKDCYEMVRNYLITNEEFDETKAMLLYSYIVDKGNVILN